MIASLALPLLSRLRHSVDILLFNPPYVPTVIDEAENAQGTAGIEGSWAGGLDGMQITDVFLQTVEVRFSKYQSLFL
jgi:release factor glutamine methyltransferase